MAFVALAIWTSRCAGEVAGRDREASDFVPLTKTRPSQIWVRHGFRVVIGLGNEMKWRVSLELTEADGSARTNEVVAGRNVIDNASPETVGLTLAEGKLILAEFVAAAVPTAGPSAPRRSLCPTVARRNTSFFSQK